MKKIKIANAIVTGLFAAFMAFSSIPDILCTADAMTFMKVQLGYPTYFIPFIGVAKLLGVAAILLPGYPRIKEWAYAGLMFDLIGALYSVKMSQPGLGWLGMLLPLGFAVASYVLYRKKAGFAANIA